MKLTAAHAGVLVLSLGCATAKPVRTASPPTQAVFPLESSRRAAGGWHTPSLDDDEPSYRGGKGLSVPHREPHGNVVDVVVRPDILRAEFAVRDVRPTSTEAVDAVRAMVAEVFGRLQAAVGTPIAYVVRSIEGEHVERRGAPVGVAATVDGHLEVALPDDLDFWTRSQRFLRLKEAVAQVQREMASPSEPLRAFRVESIAPAVKQPEAHRAALTERWIERAKAFAQAAQNKDAPLALVDCQPPAQIMQANATIESVTLRLAIQCRIDVPGTGEGRGPGRR